MMVIMTAINSGFMGFPLEGSWLLRVVNSILLVIAAQCAGCFIAGSIPDPPLAMGISAIYSAMSFSLSGFSFPVESMPTFFYSFSWLYPIRHYYLNFCDIAIFGNGFSHCWPRFCALMAFGVLTIAGAFMLRWQMQREEKLEAKTIKTDAL